jgi:hypothetical protein
MRVTQFRSGENEQLPAPKSGGLYNINGHQEGTVL